MCKGSFLSESLMQINKMCQITILGKNLNRLFTLEFGIKIGVGLLILGLFSSGYVLIKGGTFNNFSRSLEHFFLTLGRVSR